MQADLVGTFNRVYRGYIYTHICMYRGYIGFGGLGCRVEGLRFGV